MTDVVTKPDSRGNPDTMRRDVAALLEAGNATEAIALAREGLALWPDDHRLRMIEAEALHKSGASADAIEHYLRLGRQMPQGFWALLRAIRHLRDGGDLARSRAIFAAEVWPGTAPDEVKLRALAWLVSAADESEDAAAFLMALADERNETLAAEALARLSGLRARQGRETDARAMLQRIDALGQSPARARATAADLMLAEGRNAELLPLAQALAEEEPDKVEHARRLVIALLLNRRSEEAVVALMAALRRWPADWILLSRVNNLSIPTATLAACLDIVSAGAPIATMPEISRFQIALTLLTLGRTKEAIAVLASISAGGATGPMAVSLRDALAIMPAEAWRSASALDDDRAAAVQIVRVPGARTVLLAFGSPTGGYSHLPFGHFDALLAGLAVHRVYLRDGSGRGFLQGIPHFGTDDAATLDGLASLVADLGSPSIVTLGASVAGHAAARLGGQLGAHAAAMLAAPTSFENQPIQGERSSPYNRLNLLRRLARVAIGDSGVGDLVPVFQRFPETRYLFYYGAETERGERNAARLAGIPAVQLHSISVPQASLPLDLLSRPEWSAMLRDNFGLLPQ